jgi:hypothetical protein
MLCYWAVLSSLSLYEASPAEPLAAFFVPLYWEAKLVLLLALLTPASGAPRALFERLLQPAMAAAATLARDRLAPAAASAARACAGRVLPPLFARVAPLLHPSELREWEVVLRARVAAVDAAAAALGVSAAADAQRRRDASPARRSRAAKPALTAAAAGGGGSFAWAAALMSAVAGGAGVARAPAAAPAAPRAAFDDALSGSDSDDPRLGQGCRRVRSGEAAATAGGEGSAPLPSTVNSRRRRPAATS